MSSAEASGGGRPPLILASRSPQRRAILEQLGIRFVVSEPEAEELEHGSPCEVALENARRKAAAIDGELVLAVDTVVSLDGRIYGKPPDREAARATLGALSGRTHEVISGVCLVHAGRTREAGATTRVTFRALDRQVIDWYVRLEEWRERAGGYAIQGRGAALVGSIEGDYLNVVGLPAATLLELAPWLLDLTG